MDKKCSIIIPTKDKNSRLYLTLKCLEPQITEDVEVIIVFDGCTPETIEEFHNLHFSFHPIVIYQNPNVGRAAARNIGVSYSSGDVILFLDDDRLTTNNFIQKHMTYHEKEACAVLGERFDLTYPEDEITSFLNESSLDQVMKKLKSRAHKEYYYQVKKFLFAKTPLSPLRYLAFVTGNMSLDAELFHKVGGFDSEYKGWGYEDTDLGYRLSHLNVKYYLDPSNPCYHILHKHEKKQKTLDELKNNEYFRRKYPQDKALQRTLSIYAFKAKLHL